MALLAFMQQNVTGPIGSCSPLPLLFPRSKKDGANKSAGRWDVWAQNQLSSFGSAVQDTEEFRELKAWFDEIKKRLDPASSEGA